MTSDLEAIRKYTERRVKEITGEPSLEQLRADNWNLRRILKLYEPPTVATICDCCGQEYEQEVRYYDPGHDRRCDALDRHAHPTSAAEICAACRAQGASE